MPESPLDEVEIPDGPVTEAEVLRGIRRLAYGASSENVSLRGWELMGRHIGMFKDSVSEGGAPVVRLTPPLDTWTEAGAEAGAEANDGA